MEVKKMVNVLDEIDYRILELLKQRGKSTIKEASEYAGVPDATAHFRIKRMEEKDIIDGYHATINYEQLGYPMEYLIILTPKKFIINEIAEKQVQEMVKRLERINVKQIFKTNDGRVFSIWMFKNKEQMEETMEELNTYNIVDNIKVDQLEK